jgi:1,5-anhydro-D-fructose reductase (1,5-anhydro-D-mannitol-forming)
MIRVGIIGFGKMGRLRADAIVASNLAVVVTAYDPVTTIPNGIHPAASPAEIINSDVVDAVFICTPNYQNKPLTIDALHAGKHVFCEKPPAFTAAEVRDIQIAEHASGRKLMYGFNHRHHESIRTMKAAVDSGNYGRILWMRGRYGKSVDSTYLDTWRSKKKLSGGGILIDQGIHMLDLFLLLGGNFDEVHATVSNLYWKLDGIEDNVFATLRNSESGIVASLHSTMTQWRHLFSLEVFLERGYMVLNGLKTQSGTYGDEVLTVAKNRTTAPAATWQDEEQHTFHVDNSWQDETSLFLSTVSENRPVQIGRSGDALRVMQIVDAIYSAQRHEHLERHTELQSMRRVL